MRAEDQDQDRHNMTNEEQFDEFDNTDEILDECDEHTAVGHHEMMVGLNRNPKQTKDFNVFKRGTPSQQHQQTASTPSQFPIVSPNVKI